MGITTATNSISAKHPRSQWPGVSSSRYQCRDITSGGEGYKPEDAMLSGVNRKDKLTALRGLVQSQDPFFDPADENLPVFADEWFDRYERGDDITHWYGSQHVAAEHSR